MNNSNSTLFDIYSLCKDCYLLLLPGNSVAARQSQYDANECQSRGPASFGHLISSVLFSRRSLSLSLSHTHTHTQTHTPHNSDHVRERFTNPTMANASLMNINNVQWRSANWLAWTEVIASKA